ncbi:guanitoxin biosynthesis L-enduracididine beta-hydroxylase GntD [Wenjunlia tyrosinilytica]|uniref:L-asparagine oxygenase n=1 Tax=Wenjunlia tyrosinilytica TaxID=1544741 RepID=A0A917ZW98_9ACTN|nr:guanitoxin biosynthesis L-enduracididine beta-hydroxylase GntD [Wenjunlia tyrosinilytica]GGO95592.1 L-asparagine oxygenase [Wenjunlia tyrosinilytica]
MFRESRTTAPDAGSKAPTSDTDPVSTRPTGVHRYRLSPSESGEAFALASSLANEYRRVDNPRFLADVSVIAHDLPRGVRLAVNTARLDDRKHGLVICGNRVDQAGLGPTPARWQLADTPESRAHGFLIMLYGSLLGDVIAWATQQDGRIVTEVVPTPGMEESLVSSSSRKELGWHTEDAFSPYRADFVGLLCLRSPELTATTLGHLDPAAMPAEVMDVLTQPRFHIVPDASHDATLNSCPAADRRAEAFRRLDEVRRRPPLIPLVTGHPGAPVLRIDSDYVAPAEGDEEAAHALKWLIDHLDGSLYDFPLGPGDMGFIDNRNVVHGRRPFRPRYDGTDRWLKRINVVEDFRRTRPGRADMTTRVIG